MGPIDHLKSVTDAADTRGIVVIRYFSTNFITILAKCLSY